MGGAEFDEETWKAMLDEVDVTKDGMVQNIEEKLYAVSTFYKISNAFIQISQAEFLELLVTKIKT